MIKIGKITFTQQSGCARISANVDIDGDVRPLWFEVEDAYGQYLCWERSDAYVLGLLQYAIRYGHDISSETPMTRRLYEQLTGQFLPALYKLNRYGREDGVADVGYATKIECEVADEVEHPIGGDQIGSGVSCGVDSLHVFAAHPEVRYACLWSAGVHGYKESKERVEKLVASLRARAVEFAEMTGLKFLMGETNYDTGCFPDLGWEGMTTNGNLFCAYSLQKFWSKYYIASGYDIDNFHLDLGACGDPAHYEFMLFAFAALGKFVVCMDGADKSRVEKVGDLVDYAPARKFLNVCWMHNDNHRNGTYDCAKCMRTLNNLDCFNAVDGFREVFDVDYFHAHREEFLAEYYRGILHGDSFSTEMSPYFKDKHFSVRVKVKAWIIVARKIIKKILRRGRVQTSGFSSRG